jgi:tight adherence protein B
LNGLIIFFVLVTSTLFFFALLVRIFQKRKLMENRIHEFIYQQEEVKPKDKKIQRIVDLTPAKERVRKQLKSRNKGVAIEMRLQQAGVPLKPEEYVMFQWISFAFFAGFFYLLKDSIIVLIFGAVFGIMLPKLILKSRKKNRLQQFNVYLPEMITTLVNALRAGFSFLQALKNAAEEAPSPVKEELEITLREMQFGVSVEESLNRLHERMPSDDLDLMIQAILIQRQVGGNLAVVLEKNVHTIRERIKIQGQIKTLTAQGKMSGTVVALLPLGLSGMLSLVNPGYMTPLFTTPIGIALLCIAGVSMLIGFLLITKITTIEV